MRTTTVTVAGITSPVMETGPEGATEAVVFVHGNPGAGRDWEDLLGRVGAFARAVAPDMPGYAAADKPRDLPYTVAGYARHLDGVVEQLGIERVHLVLHDFGGAWGLRWAADHPGRFASVTLLNTGVLIGYRWHRFARIWRTPVLGELFQASAFPPSVRFLVQRENPKLPAGAVRRIAEQARAKETKRAILALYRATPEPVWAEPVEALRALDRPALVIWADRDPYLPVEQAERQKAAFPSARVELMPGHGHWAFLEDPERVAALVVPFLQEQVQ